MSGCPDCESKRSWRWWLIAGIVVLAAVLLAELVGCGSRAMTIGPLEPTPKVDLPPQSSPVALDLARTADTIRVRTDGSADIEVRSFRRTLENAFHRGFMRASSTNEGAAALTLVVEVTSIAFVTSPMRASAAERDDGAAIILVHGTPATRQPKAPRRRRYVELAFRAFLRDGTSGIARTAGHVHSTEAASAGERDAIARCLSSAVEELYEQLARDLFARRTVLREVRP